MFIIKKSNYAKAFMMLPFILMTFSCDDNDNIITPEISIVSGETIDFGDVPAGSAGTKSFNVRGSGLNLPITLNVSGDRMSITKTLFPAANINNSAEIIFSPSRDQAQVGVNGTIELSSGDISKTINVIANVVEPEPLPVETEIYFNDMEFGLDHNTPATTAILEGSHELHSSVMATYVLNKAGNNESRIRVNAQFPKCADGSALQYSGCGNALRIVGETSSVTVNLIGLEADRNYEVSYWIRPGGSSERSLDVTITGDTEDAYENWGNNDKTKYHNKIRTGIADSDGNFQMTFQYSYNSTGRTISLEDLSVTAK